MVDIPLFDGPSFREIVLMVGFIVAAVITVVVTVFSLVGYWIWRCFLCGRSYHRRRQLDRRLNVDGADRIYHSVGDDTNERALFEMAEGERSKRVRRVKWALIYIVLWTWIFFIGAGPLVWIVIMDYLPWWAGWLCADAVLLTGWFLFFPFYCRPRQRPADVARVDKTTLRDSGYVLVEDDDSFVGDTRMNSINPSTGVHSHYFDEGNLGGMSMGKPRTYNPFKLTARFLRKRARRVRRRPYTFVAGLLFWVVFIFSFTFVFEGLCIGEYPISIDFRLVRQLQASTCPTGAAPCHVYLTFPPGNMSSSIVVHSHTSDLSSYCTTTVYYDTVSRKNGTIADYRYNHTGTHFKYETKDFTRYIHWVKIDTLEPDTVYYFRTGCGSGDNLFSAEKRFLSAPGPDVKNFTFVTGGDMGTSEETDMIEAVAAELNPRFVFLGGDLAYANAMPTCYRVWDKWFDMWERNMVTRDGNYIPLVAIVGNHETGGGSSLHASVSDIPFFFRYFHLYPGDDQVKLEQRQRKKEKVLKEALPVVAPVSEAEVALQSAESIAPVLPSPALVPDEAPPSDVDLALPNVYLTDAWDTTFHHHFVGDHLFLNLDSGMFLDVQGAQTTWLTQVLESWNATHNSTRLPDGNLTRPGYIMAVYHVPMWPSDRGVDVWQRDMRQYWEPLFDAYHVAVGFENHSHRYGRATHLKAGKANPEGTLYLGGGSFGVTPSASGSWPWYMENIQQKRHFLHVQVTPDEIHIDVIDEHGEVFDHAKSR